jgi:Protein of unknown function (DUF3500)/Secretion system C-terminal sorting domain
MKLFLILFISLPLLFTTAVVVDQKLSTAEASCMIQACESLSDVEKVVCLSETFKATLTSAQLASLQLAYSLDNARKWSNLPAALSARIGLRLGDLSTTQLDAAQKLIEAATGAQEKEGYNEIYQLWRADDYLGANGGGTTYGAGNFYIGFFGVPSLTGKWQLQMTGHHMTVSNTYENGKLKGGTPSFRAAEPFDAFTYNNETHHPLTEEYTTLKDMLAGLDATTLASAKLTGTFSDIVLGPNKDWVFPTVKSGVKCSNLSTSQKNAVLNAIMTYVNDLDEMSAAAFMQKYESEIDDTYISYAGNPALTAQRDYVRIDGPSIWIEYSVQRGIVLNPNHPHSIWRDRNFDYGGTGNPLSATNQIAQNIRFIISPNPVQTNMIVSLENPLTSDATIIFYDMQGKVVISHREDKLMVGPQNISIPLGHLHPGTYLCVVRLNAGQTLYSSSKTVVKI